ncbi:MAG: type IV-A pilus assembly ATPase PilB [Planctomycetota bacterium]|nr:MAG: type IV-A pilus assembly ATPase PilB [Planctomycetota bacterium]
MNRPTVSPEALQDQPLLVRLLLEQGELEASQLDAVNKARLRFPGDVETALIHSNLVTEQDVARNYAEHLGVPWLDVAASEKPDDDALWVVESRDGGEPLPIAPLSELVAQCRSVSDAIGDVVCRKHSVVPVGARAGSADLACLNPCDFSVIEEVRMRAGCVVRPRGATLRLVTEMISALYGERDMVREIAGEDGGSGASQVANDDEMEVVVDLGRPIPNTKDSQVIRIANILLSTAIDEGASDIHLEPYEDTVRVRYRVDGKMLETTPPPKALFVPTISRLKILSKMDIAERRLPQDGSIALKHGDRRVDLRVSTVPTVYGEKMVIRILEKGGIPDSMLQLGFSEKQSEAFLEAANSPHGLMFVTGPTGSGKSTTLYCCLNLINKPDVNIVTVEDPVEYKFTGLNQVHVRTNVGLTFASALRAFLRQDPDKIMVGEVRDQETAQICMRAALTGHLVLSTLHTNNSLQVINRLVDMGIEPFLLGPALRLLEAQRLARRLCPDCKEAYELPDQVAERHGLEAGLTLFRAVGKSCLTCRGTGSKGRVGMYEVVAISEALRELISSGASQNDIKREAKREGVRFLEDDARDKLRQGVTSLEEVAEYIRVSG